MGFQPEYSAQQKSTTRPRPGASIMRVPLRTPTLTYFMRRVPLSVGRAEDARAASTRLLTLNLYNSVHKPSLLRLCTADLHESTCSSCSIPHRRTLVDTASARCSRRHEPILYIEWRELWRVVLSDLECRPFGGIGLRVD